MHPTAIVVINGDDVYEDLFTAVEELNVLLTDEGFATRTGMGMARFVDPVAEDLVVLYTAMGEFTGEQREGLRRAVDAGTGLLAIHSTNVGGDERLIGSRYVSHGPPPHETTFTVELGDHEITRGLKPFEITHEHYEVATTDDVEVLAWRGSQPLVHVRVQGRGRVCYVQLGHDRRAWAHPDVRTLVRQAARWTGREVARCA